MSYLILEVHKSNKIFHISHFRWYLCFKDEYWSWAQGSYLRGAIPNKLKHGGFGHRPPLEVGSFFFLFFVWFFLSLCSCFRVCVFLDSLPVQVLHILLSSSVGFLLRRVQK